MKTSPLCRRLLVVFVLSLAGRAFGQASSPTGPTNPYAVWDLADLPASQDVIEGRNVIFSTDLLQGVTIEWQQSKDRGVTWTPLVEPNGVLAGYGASAQITAVKADMDGLLIRFFANNNVTSFTSQSCVLSVSRAYLPMPLGIVTDSQNNLYITDQSTHMVYQGQVAPYTEQNPNAKPVCKLSALAGQSGVTGKADGMGLGATFNQPAGVTYGPGGLLLVTDAANGTIRKVTLAGNVTTFAGDSSNHGNVDALGIAARFSTPQGIARGPDSSYYVADTENHTIRRVGSDGSVVTFAGVPGSAGWADGTSTARFNRPQGVAVDQSGVVYVADTGNNLIRKITLDGVVSTLAGIPGVAGAQAGAPTQATFNGPVGVAVSPDGSHIWVADTGNSIIRVMHRALGYNVDLLAGQPTVSGLQDGSPGLLDHPRMITVDNVTDPNGDGNTLYIADTGNAAIRKFTRLSNNGLQTIHLVLADSQDPTPPPPVSTGSSSDGTNATIPSSSSSASTSSGGGALSGEFFAALAGLGLLRFRRRLRAGFLRARRGLRFMAMNFPRRSGSVLCALMLTVIRVCGQAGPNQPTFVSPSRQSVTEGRNTQLTAGGAVEPIQWQISTDDRTFTDLVESNVYVGTTTKTLELVGVTAAMGNHYFRFSSAFGSARTTGYSSKLTVSPLRFPMPAGIAMDNVEQLYISDEATHTVYKGLVVPVDIRAGGLPLHLTLSALAGRTGTAGAADGTGNGALFSHPASVAVDPAGVVTLADSANGTIRQISVTGVVSTLAGDSANRGNSDGAGAAARFATPRGIARAPDGSYYVADADNHTIRKVTANGLVTTFAGSPGNAGTADGAGSVARFNHPEGIAVDNFGTIYVADTANNSIRQITPDGVVSTLAGIPGMAGAENGIRTQATFNAPGGIAVSSNGQMIFVADTGNSTIRLMSPGGNYSVSVFAGMPTVSGMSDGYAGMLDHPKAIAVDGSTDYYFIRVFIADTGNAAIRQASWDNGLETLLLWEGADAPPTPPPVPLATMPPPGVAQPSPAASSRSDSGGGGAPSGEFLSALVGLWLLRRRLGGGKPDAKGSAA